MANCPLWEENLRAKNRAAIQLRLKAFKATSWESEEYADLQLNIYSRCYHGCKYGTDERCYNGDKFDNWETEIFEKASLENIEHDLRLLAFYGERPRIHITFIADPYDMGRKDNSYIRKVLELFRKYCHPFQILTKGGTKAAADFVIYGPNDWFGCTLTFDNDADSKEWEPGAALPADRIEALRQAHERGIKTWVSLEPVIDPAQSLHLIDLTHEFVDFYGVGKLNHNPELEKTIDWRKYRADAEAKLKGYDKQYMIKRSLRRA